MSYRFALVTAIAVWVTTAQSAPVEVRADQFLQVTSVRMEVDGTNVRMTIQLVNRAPQPITAYAVAGTAHFRDGRSESHEITKDLLISTMVNPHVGATPRESFGPGEMATAVILMTASTDGNSPVQGTATATMVAFLDRTAAGDADAISRIAAARQNQAQETSDIMEDLKRISSSRDVGTAISELAAEVSRPKGTTDAERLRSEHHQAWLKMLAEPFRAHPEAVGPYLEACGIRLKTLREHQSLKRIEGGQ